MTMTRDVRKSETAWNGADRRSFDRPGGLPLRLAETALRNPVTTGGIALSLVMIALVVSNAVGNQPLRHPHPWFTTREAPAAAVAPATTGTTADPATLLDQPQRRPSEPARATAPVPAPATATGGGVGLPPGVLPRPKPTTQLEGSTVQDLQQALLDRGYYTGPVDGVVGPATIEAVKAFERRLGAPPTGDITELLIAALRASPAVETTGSTPRAAATPTPPPKRSPTPSMRTPVADAVAHPVATEEADLLPEVEMAVTTGSIRRAAREPLAPGGDDRLQMIQRALVAAGYGPLRADGRWDDKSTAAVRRYEADRGWTVSGRPTDRLVYDLMGRVATTR